MSTEFTLPELPSFDTTGALKLLNNNQKLYGNVLKRFLGQYSTAYDALSVQLSNLPEDPAGLVEAQREVHTLKGLAGTIGHPALQEAATRFDAAAKEPNAHNREELAALGGDLLQKLAQALQTLKQTFPS